VCTARARTRIIIILYICDSWADYCYYIGVRIIIIIIVMYCARARVRRRRRIRVDYDLPPPPWRYDFSDAREPACNRYTYMRNDNNNNIFLVFRIVAHTAVLNPIQISSNSARLPRNNNYYNIIASYISIIIIAI